jgi:predicted unusual protein kinase regulating ubiquinone biosynthesis (AarF/ABC1/UbiB family)
MPIPSVRRMAGHIGLAQTAYRLRKADQDQVSRQARRHLIERMGKMRGLPQKLGQLISFSSARETTDPLAAADYALLQEQAEPLPLEVVQPLLEAAWGRRLEDVVESIEPHAHAASLGQVHQATLKDGRSVAIKVQYPGIHEAVLADLKILGWLSAPVGGLRRGFNLAAYREVILNDMQLELDYACEAENQRHFAAFAANHPFLQVPQVIDEYSTPTVLVSEWQEGEHWQAVRENWPEDRRHQLARGLLDFFLESLFDQGLLHADWHPGNLRFLRQSGGPQLLLYDFGCVYHPSQTEQLALLRLIKATQDGSEPPLPLMLALGFQREYLEPFADKLPALCRLLFEPFCVDYAYPVGRWRLAERTADILGDDRLNFRIAGPPAMIFLLRAFHGLAYYLEGLQADIVWNRPLRNHLDRLATAMAAVPLPTVDQSGQSFSSLARFLKMQVREYDQTKVQLSFNASRIDDLDSLLDEPVKQKIHKQGIALDDIVRDVRRRGYTPGPVFELQADSKTVRVWLE